MTAIVRDKILENIDRPVFDEVVLMENRLRHEIKAFAKKYE